MQAFGLLPKDLYGTAFSLWSLSHIIIIQLVIFLGSAETGNSKNSSFYKLILHQHSISIPPENVRKIRGFLIFSKIIELEHWCEVGGFYSSGRYSS